MNERHHEIHLNERKNMRQIGLNIKCLSQFLHFDRDYLKMQRPHSDFYKIKLVKTNPILLLITSIQFCKQIMPNLLIFNLLLFLKSWWRPTLIKLVLMLQLKKRLYWSVVYFDQRLGAAHLKRWSNFFFFFFFVVLFITFFRLDTRCISFFVYSQKLVCSKNVEKYVFNQQTACKAPVCWSKYTTLHHWVYTSEHYFGFLILSFTYVT